MDYITVKEASEKWGVTPSTCKLLLRRWPYSRCCEDGWCVADPQNCGEAD